MSVPPLGRLPDADKGTIGGTIQHIRDIFGRMGFNDREMVALIGAHAVGRCHTDASGTQFSHSGFTTVNAITYLYRVVVWCRKIPIKRS